MGNAYLLKNGFKVVGTDGRISGTWVVLKPAKPGARVYIKPHEVTIYDEARHSGIVLYSADLQASVCNGEADIDRIAERWRAEVADVDAEVRSLLLAVALAASGEDDE